jgi:hypothetical protein
MGGNESQSEREVKTGYPDETQQDISSGVNLIKRNLTFQEVNGALKPEMIRSWFLVEQNLIPLR